MRKIDTKYKYGRIVYDNRIGEFSVYLNNIQIFKHRLEDDFYCNNNPYKDDGEEPFRIKEISISEDGRTLFCVLEDGINVIEQSFFGGSHFSVLLNRAIFKIYNENIEFSEDKIKFSYVNIGFYSGREGYNLKIIQGKGSDQSDHFFIYSMGHELFYNKIEPFGRVKVDAMRVINDSILINTEIGDKVVSINLPSSVMSAVSGIIDSIDIRDLPQNSGHKDLPNISVPRILRK